MNKEILAFLSKCTYDIVNLQYTIMNDAITILDENTIDISNQNLIKIPYKFISVPGSFICSFNQLATLENCPDYVGHDFICTSNKLETLKHAPKDVGGSFYCAFNKLKNLEYSPEVHGECYYCNNNYLESLSGIRQMDNTVLYCFNNKHLKSLTGLSNVKDIICDEQLNDGRSRYMKVKNFE